MPSKKSLKLALLHVARATGLFALARRATARGVRVLCYHGVWLGDPAFTGDAMFIQAETFKARLATLARLGYPVVTLAQAVGALRSGDALAANAVVITIDDGWFSTYQAMVPALAGASVPATLYCDTAHLTNGRLIPHVMARYIVKARGIEPLEAHAQAAFDRATRVAAPWAERWDALQELARLIGVDLAPLIDSRAFHYMTEAELRDAFERGAIDVQLHTHNHSLHDLSFASVTREIAANRAALAGILGTSPDRFVSFCYPSGVHGGAAIAALEACGITSSTTTTSGLCFPDTPRQMLPRFIDGDNVSHIEFEAEMSGFTHLLRAAVRRAAPAPHGVPQGA